MPHRSWRRRGEKLPSRPAPEANYRRVSGFGRKKKEMADGGERKGGKPHKDLKQSFPGRVYEKRGETNKNENV